MSLKEKKQAGEPETELVRIYKVVNYIIHFFDFTLLWNTSNKLLFAAQGRANIMGHFLTQIRGHILT